MGLEERLPSGFLLTTVEKAKINIAEGKVRRLSARWNRLVRTRTEHSASHRI